MSVPNGAAAAASAEKFVHSSTRVLSRNARLEQCEQPCIMWCVVAACVPLPQLLYRVGVTGRRCTPVHFWLEWP